jgi:hypothetical protein
MSSTGINEFDGTGHHYFKEGPEVLDIHRFPLKASR